MGLEVNDCFGEENWWVVCGVKVEIAPRWAEPFLALTLICGGPATMRWNRFEFPFLYVSLKSSYSPSSTHVFSSPAVKRGWQRPFEQAVSKVEVDRSWPHVRRESWGR